MQRILYTHHNRSFLRQLLLKPLCSFIRVITMLFRTTFIVALLSTFSSVLAAPVDITSLAERSEEASLIARDVGVDSFLEERDFPLEERDDEDFYEIIARSPEAELEFEEFERRDNEYLINEERSEYTYDLLERAPAPELEDLEARGKLGLIFKIGKKIASAVHKGHSANNNNNNQRQKRSKIGNKIKSFFKKVGNGVRIHSSCLYAIASNYFYFA